MMEYIAMCNLNIRIHRDITGGIWLEKLLGYYIKYAMFFIGQSLIYSRKNNQSISLV
jgi:hypothetical protein